ncbi:coenzyme F420-0:L-glutamate ligase / coenzyme F420-1:gamma-L-glutamate ligase [Micromonospora nigra]|uniref:Coenzyme F420-0:L-glutamate ligase / coenzyme F420-1:gamma-L-glutamate ligase n=1 Tax=Micromonospora nigra TaxID=145857 RepID=A0A1C6SF24_9ACTN|nr:coenzyme F420-0:L-glutamate ligase [Micromonospora nigra]SCL28017.1 coenzyme F420-0:L-glutamate ligase / coenzyme F420-1:gamma-L-glutamate ligase [Micromonospora nigra]
MRLEILPVPGIGHVTEGDDLAVLIGTAAPWLRDGDVLVVTSKIVSKAEGRLVDVPADGPERLAARDEVLAAETARVVAARGATRIVQTHHGFVMAAAGIDASNVDKTRLVLLPEDPDASARALRAALRERYGVDVAVVVSDTMGRPWRNGLTDVALGVAGLPAIRDHRGEVDPYGNELQLTQMAVVDELAGAGELIKGKCDQVPVAVVRGYLNAPLTDDDTGARALIRDASMDLFSLGTAEARAAGLSAAATLPDGTGEAPADPAAVGRAITAVAGAVAPGTVFTHVTDAGVRAGLVATVPGWPADASGLVLCSPPTPVNPPDLVRFGGDVHRLRAALAAEHIPTVLLPPPTATTAAATLAL